MECLCWFVCDVMLFEKEIDVEVSWFEEVVDSYVKLEEYF